jgi:hypothetical protein
MPVDYGPPPDAHDASYPMDALEALAREEPQAAPMPGQPQTVWRQAHPSAQRWVAKRGGSSVRSPKPGIISLGLLLTGIGVYLLTIFLPSKAPLTAAAHEAMKAQAGVDENAWRFTDQLFTIANLNAGLFVLLGMVIMLRGALHRQLPPGQPRPKSKMAPALLASFLLLAITFVALIMKASVR